MGQTLKMFGYVLLSAVTMAAAVEIVRHYEAKITDTTDELITAGGRLWSRAMDEARLESEVRRALPWVLWFAWEAQEDAVAEGNT